MEISLTNTIISVLDSTAQIKPKHLSQLLYYGFTKINTNEYQCTSDLYIPLLLKLIRYFDKQGLKYSLNDKCSSLYHQLQEKQRLFKQSKQLAHAFKEGNSNPSAISGISDFLFHALPRKLKDHQIKAAIHLYLSQNGANFSVPGSGKTAVVLSVYEKLRRENIVNTIFVVGPPSCFGPWRSEYKLTLGKDPNVKILAGGNSPLRKSEYFEQVSNVADIYLTTFQTLTNDQKEVISFFNQPQNNVFLVIDEAHYIKQISGAWADAVLRISTYAARKCVLTGTPMPRSYKDVFNLYDCLWPLCDPISSEVKARIEASEASGDAKQVKSLFDTTISPLFYRVRKSDLGLKPAIFHPPYIVKMNPNERLVYDAVVTNITNYSEEDFLRNIDLVSRLRRARIIRLRQAVSYTKLLGTALDDYEEDVLSGNINLRRIVQNYDSIELPAKLERLLSLVCSLRQRNRKVVIWSNFIGSLELIKSSLEKGGHYTKLIYGNTPIEQTSLPDEDTRESIRSEFIAPNSGLDILIANPAACAESISLHKTCFDAIYYDLSYNCAQYLQSLDRIHRVGGSEINEAHYHFLQYENSLDQDIKANLDNKSAKMYDIVEQDYEIYSLDMFEDDDNIADFNRIIKNA